MRNSLEFLTVVNYSSFLYVTAIGEAATEGNHAVIFSPVAGLKHDKSH